jgi:hypothetical protein
MSLPSFTTVSVLLPPPPGSELILQFTRVGREAVDPDSKTQPRNEMPQKTFGLMAINQ